MDKGCLLWQKVDLTVFENVEAMPTSLSIVGGSTEVKSMGSEEGKALGSEA
jgi:hypothetical protein